jgi:diacylglycerol kinase family enzyme
MSIAVLVNVRARHGSHTVGEKIRAILPDARVAVTHSLEDARAWVRDDLVHARPKIVLSGGGDGTATALLNELRAHGVQVPVFGLLPLGTGNGWARATGDVGTRAALRGLAALRAHVEERPEDAPPVRTFDLVEAEGRLAPFAGTGWDAEVLADYKRFTEQAPAALRTLGGATFGYLQSLFTRTIPRHLGGERPRVRVVNLGEPALRADADGRPVPVPGGGAGAVLYEGPLSVGGASITEELGLGFRAFPFAHLVPGRMCVRVYAATTMSATLRIASLWRGAHPLPDDHHFFVTKVRFELDRPMPIEIGGDLLGDRTTLELSRVPEAVPLVDWRKMS